MPPFLSASFTVQMPSYKVKIYKDLPREKKCKRLPQVCNQQHNMGRGKNTPELQQAGRKSFTRE